MPKQRPDKEKSELPPREAAQAELERPTGDDLQEQPESTIGRKGSKEGARPRTKSADDPARIAGARSRAEEGEETEHGSEIRDREDGGERVHVGTSRRTPPDRGTGIE
jgi:hypothetical protein